MAGWNLALRFGLEVAAVVGWGAAAWSLTDGSLRWLAAAAVPSAAIAGWAVFNVVGDPSRSGAAPIEVPGWVRLAIEIAVLGGGAAGYAIAGRGVIAIGLAVATVGHYVASWSRVRWLLRR